MLTDISEPMLELARRRVGYSVRCEQMDAFCPHFAVESIQGVFAFLADGYNHPLFFEQARGMLAFGGCLVLTVPSHTVL